MDVLPLQNSSLLKVLNDLLALLFDYIQNLLLDLLFLAVELFIGVFLEEPSEQELQLLDTAVEGIVAFDKQKGVNRLQHEQSNRDLENGFRLQFGELLQAEVEKQRVHSAGERHHKGRKQYFVGSYYVIAVHFDLATLQAFLPFLLRQVGNKLRSQAKHQNPWQSLTTIKCTIMLLSKHFSK